MPGPRAYTPTLPGALVEALQKALAQDPQDRFASAAALSQAVQQAMGLTPSSAMPSNDAGGWGAGPPPDEGWLDAPTWTGQGNPQQRYPGGGGGQPPMGGGPPGGWPPDNDPYYHRRGWPPLVALALALFLLVVCSSLAYGYFGLGWLHPHSGVATATPSPTSSPQPTNTPTSTPTAAPSPTPAPSPSPTSVNPSPTPARLHRLRGLRLAPIRRPHLGLHLRLPHHLRPRRCLHPARRSQGLRLPNRLAHKAHPSRPCQPSAVILLPTAPTGVSPI